MLIGKDDNDMLTHFPKVLLILRWFPHPSTLNIEREGKKSVLKRSIAFPTICEIKKSLIIHFNCTNTYTHAHTPFSAVN